MRQLKDSQLRVRERSFSRHVLVQKQRQHGQHCVERGVAHHQPSAVNGDGGEKEDGGEDGLRGWVVLVMVLVLVMVMVMVLVLVLTRERVFL